ncbi:MAG: hypothetical protein Q8R82_01615 [Hyphomonadaceae bacterium]|nr:hypothetical protein [Hyphomonadaceae bacterium]
MASFGLAAITGLTVLAYKDPALFLRIYLWVFGAVVFLFSVVFAFVAGEGLATERLAPLIAIAKRPKLPAEMPEWFATFAVACAALVVYDLMLFFLAMHRDSQIKDQARRSGNR